jgi:hypothetical protein
MENIVLQVLVPNQKGYDIGIGADLATGAVRGMWGVVVSGIVACVSTAAPAQVMPRAFEDQDQIVCVDKDTAIALAAAYEHKPEQAEKLLARLAEHGLCERIVFSGRPSAEVYGENTNKLRDLHVFEVEATKGRVLNGKTKVFMLLYIVHDNEV